jgi:Acetyltransferase (GNAT) domain
MNFTIEIVNIYDERIDLELRNLIKAAFNSADLLPEGHLAGNIKSNASKASFCLAAKFNGTIVGCNAFLANDFSLNGVSYVGYQSCWGATHPDHWGKGIFTGLNNEAKQILKEEGAGFIYGLALDNSHSILINRLGFREIPSVVTRIPNLPFFKNLYLQTTEIDKTDVCFINEKQVQEHKALQFPTEVKTFSHNNSWVWGKLINKVKFGIKIPVFYAGGFCLADENDLKFLIAKIFRAHRVLFIQVLSCGSNNLNPLFKGWKPSKMNPFIFYNLNMPPIKHFNITLGAIDIF